MSRNKLLILSIICLSAILASIYNYDKKSGQIPNTDIQINERVINIGNTKISEPSEAHFVIRNIGENDLIIKEIVTDCHCTAIIPNQKKTIPGDSLVLTAKYDNNSTGFFNQAITVHLNTESSPELLIIRGRIVE